MNERYFDVLIDENNKYRLFAADVDDGELVWHQDARDRVVWVLSGKGWQFQFDNELPIQLEEGITIKIPNHIYHRVIKGTNDLIIKITEN